MKKILVIEDEKSLREEISDILRFEGFEVLQAENGIIGETLAKKHLPDLILCDIMMPGISGTDVLVHLLTDETTNRIPFIFMSALAERKHLRTGMELGADDYITKPFTVQEILKAIRTRLDKNEVSVKYLEKAIEDVRKEMLKRLEQVSGASSFLTAASEDQGLYGSTSDSNHSMVEALRSIESNNTLKNLEKLIARELSKGDLPKDTERSFIRLRNEIKNKNILVNNWTIFQLKFNQAYPGLVERLLKHSPKLTPQDLTLASAIVLNLNTQQIAGLLNITSASVRKSKYRLKLKLHLVEDKQLGPFLHSLKS